MDYLVLSIVAVFGLVTGSFLNVLIARYNELASVVTSRSHCPHCKKIIAWYDLVPLFSFMLLQAKCRYCKEKISWFYPTIELLTALLASHLYLVYGLTPSFVLFLIIFCLLIVISVIDIRDFSIPDSFMLPAILLAFIAAFAWPNPAHTLPFWGVLLSGGLLATIVLISRERWMGAGDIGFGILMGLLAGFMGSIIGLVIAFTLGSVISLILLALKKKTGKDMIPFGPFLAIGCYVATIWGNQLMNWYLQLVKFY